MTNLAEKMLRVAEENAARRGLENVETRQADAGALPFADATFDAVMARFGFMFFPDVLGSARELARVARPGARVTTAVWGAPEKNPWATTIMSTIGKHVDLPVPPPGAPGLFRCAAPGYMAGVFREAGLRNVTEREVAVPALFDDAEPVLHVHERGGGARSSRAWRWQARRRARRSRTRSSRWSAGRGSRSASTRPPS